MNNMFEKVFLKNKEAVIYYIKQNVKPFLETYKSIISYEVDFLEDDKGEKDTIFLDIKMDEDIYLAEYMAGKREIQDWIEPLIPDPFLIAIEINGKSIYE